MHLRPKLGPPAQRRLQEGYRQPEDQKLYITDIDTSDPQLP